MQLHITLTEEQTCDKTFKIILNIIVCNNFWNNLRGAKDVWHRQSFAYYVL